jgi:hypothetical protein
MNQLKYEAERLRLGIRGGWLLVRCAVAWADERIAQSPEPHPALLDISLAGTRPPNEVVSLLADVPGSADPIAVMRACLADLLRTVEREPALGRAVAQWLYVSATQGDLPEAHFGWQALAIDDEFALAAQGIGTSEAAQARLLAFLREHARA